MDEIKQLPKKIKLILTTSAGLIIMLLVTVGLLMSSTGGDSTKLSEKEKQSIADDISEVMVLSPTDKPNIIALPDADQLKRQAFFQNAEPGDVIAVYQESKRAILWRSKDKKIVEVSVIDLTNPVQ